jgi:hypothetical protein
MALIVPFEPYDRSIETAVAFSFSNPFEENATATLTALSYRLQAVSC